MTKARHVLNRTNVCHGLCAVALLGLSLVANASTYPNGTRANGQNVWNQAMDGKRTTVNGQGSGTGSPAKNVTGNADVLDASGNVIVSGGATVGVNGSNVAVQASGKINKSDIANAAVAAAGCAVGGGGVVGAVVCGGVALAIPIATNWMANAGVRVNPDSKALEVKDTAFNGCSTVALPAAWIGQPLNAACGGEQGITGLRVISLNNVCVVANKCMVHGEVVVEELPNVPTPAPWRNGTVAEAVGLMNNSRIPSAEIVRELEAAGQTPAMPIKDVIVTGPASVQGPTTTSVTNNTTTNTTTNTSTTTNNYTYNNNIVTNTTSRTVTTTSTAVKNPDGTTTTTAGPTTTTTTNPGDPAPVKPEEPPVQCDKYPNSLGCAELDTPTAEIPRETKTITFEAEDMLGGGQCPADVMTTLNTLGGRSVKVVDWQTFCGMAVPLRALVMGLAAIMAFFIIMPGGVRE